MTLRVAADSGEAMRLDGTALRALIAAVEFQLSDWRAKSASDLDEDDLADLQNDIQYLEILLDRLKSDYRRTDPLQGI